MYVLSCLSVVTMGYHVIHLMYVLVYVLPCLSVVTMGYHVPLDVCFGDQLAGSAHEPMHRGWHTFSS